MIGLGDVHKTLRYAFKSTESNELHHRKGSVHHTEMSKLCKLFLSERGDKNRRHFVLHAICRAVLRSYKACETRHVGARPFESRLLFPVLRGHNGAQEAFGSMQGWGGPSERLTYASCDAYIVHDARLPGLIRSRLHTMRT